ncbi:hypothetical protein BGZ51_001805, partial [Haplosporangium sp. Z 767]
TDEQFISIMEAMGNIKQSIGELTKERTDAEHAGNGDSRITEGAGDIVSNSSASAAKIQESLSRATIDTQDASADDGDVDVAPDLFKGIPVVDIFDGKAPQGKGRPKGKRLRASYEVKQDRKAKGRHAWPKDETELTTTLSKQEHPKREKLQWRPPKTSLDFSKV